MRTKFQSVGWLVIAACAVLPPLGAWLAGRPLAQFCRFPPPLEIPADYPRFSWWAIGLLAGVSLAVAWPWMRGRHALRRNFTGSGWNAAAKVARSFSPRQATVERGLKHRATENTAPVIARFPWWGRVGVAWTLLWWVLAWTRVEWFAWAQRYTFTPLWLGFIVVVNALTCARSGSCLLVREPSKLARLFGASAVFWWGFEYLNRFVQNWHYLGVEGVGPLEYTVHASVCFSTVLPAVASVREWLGTFPRLDAQLAAGPAWSWLGWRGMNWGLVLLGVVGLGLTGARPLHFYPALWSAPLLLAVGLALQSGESGWWREVIAGDWREAGAWALAAVVCGFFWELWNVHSFAKWIYTVPFVETWRVFEMPLAGYTGYLTFGLECAFAVRWVESFKRK